YSKPEDFTDGPVEFAMTDVSFISLKLILPPLKAILMPHGHAVALIKPQFEAGPAHVGKHGIVRDPQVHRDVLKMIVNFASATGYNVLGLAYSPIKGGEGNIEFLIHLQNADQTPGEIAPTVDIERTLSDAYAALKRP
ncbi:cell division protein FtsJ, partial [Lacticaseibacillus rhamnosus]